MGVTGERRTVGGKARLQIKGCFVDKAERGWGSIKRKYQCSEKSLVLEYVSELNWKGAFLAMGYSCQTSHFPIPPLPI